MNKTLLFYTLTPATATLLALSAHAQDAIVDLGSDIVTADAANTTSLKSPVSSFRTGTPLINIPRSVSVFSKERIDEQGIDSIGDIVDYTPGVNNSQGEGHRDSIVFRGQGRSTADFFVDGIRDDVQYYRPLYNVEQVEILRGSSALLFGRGGAGGILNRSIKKAKLGETFGEYQGSINSFGSFSNQFDYNTPLSDGSAFRLNAFTESLENHRDFFEGDRLGVNPTLTLKLNEKTDLFLSYEYADHERFVDRGIPSLNGRPARQLSGITFGDRDLNETTFEAHVFKATLKHEFSDAWKGSVTGFYGNYDKVYTNLFAANVFDPATNTTDIYGYTDRTDRERFSISGDLVGEFNTGNIGHKVLLGAEYINTSSDQDRFNIEFDNNIGRTDQARFPVNGSISGGVIRDASGNVLSSGTFTDLQDDTEVDINVFSIFLHDEIAINDKLDLILGARFDSFDIDVLNNDENDVVNRGRRSRRDEEISPRIGLIYKPVDDLSLYASFSETFTPRSGEQFADIDGDNDALEPNVFTNYEVGVKWNIQDRFSLSLAAFQIEEESPTISDIDVDRLIINETETRGFETQLEGYVTDNWHITAGYSYLDGEQASSSNTPREQPQNSFSLWNSYTVNENFGFGLGLIYQGSSFADNSNRTEIPSYVRVDASAYYKVSDSLKVQLNIENLLDRDYFPSAHTANNITVGAPINATLKVTKTF